MKRCSLNHGIIIANNQQINAAHFRQPRRLRLARWGAALVGLSLLASAHAELVKVSQMIGFTSGNLGTVGVSESWNGGNANVTLTNGSGSLDGVPLGLAGSAGDKAEISATDVFGTYSLFAPASTFRANTTTNAYYSFLYRFNNDSDVSTTGERIVQINRQNSGSAYTVQIQAINVSGQLQIGVNKTNGTVAYAPRNISVGETVFVVVRHQIVAGTTPPNDLVDLWINPAANSFGLDEGSIPTPAATATDGGEDASNTGPGRFHLVAGANATFDEFRVGTTWADVTPSASTCNPADVTTHPLDQSQTADLPATFSVASSGTSPTFQWQISTNSGTSWNNIAGAIAPNHTTPNLTLADNGSQFRAIVNVSCGTGSSATSSVATLTVNAPVPTPVGVVVDDRWTDLLRDDPPVTQSNSVWRGSTLDASTGALLATPAANSSRLWMGYFTDDSVLPILPVHLDVGRALKTTIVFTPNNPVTNGGSMRFGLFDYADGGTRLSNDSGGGSAGNGTNVRGYMLGLDFGTTFNDNTPMELYARINLGSPNLMGGTGEYVSLGQGPSALNGTNAFVSGVPYTMVFQVVRTAANSVDVSTSISDGTNQWAFSATDTNYAYHRFDSFGVRPNSLETTADNFTFTRFLVEVTQASVPFRVTDIRLVSPQAGIMLTWESVAGRSYQVQSRDALDAGNWISNVTVTANSPSTAYATPWSGATPQRFYRIMETP